MKDDLKIIGSILAIITVVFVVILAISKPPQDISNLTPQQAQEVLVRPDSFTLKAKNSPAKVSFVEFADMQCPSCATIHPVVKRLQEKYADNLSYTFRHYPLPQHPHAVLAAKLVESAGKQNNFTQMQDLLFQRQAEWSKEKNPLDLFKKYYQELKLDLSKFEQDLNDSSLETKINKDVADGNTLNVNATPTFFINGTKYSGDYSLAALEQTIDNLLK